MTRLDVGALRSAGTLLGLPGVVALALLACAAWLGTAQRFDRLAAIDDVRGESRAADRRLALARRKAAGGERSGAAGGDAALAWPSAARRTADMASILDAAESGGLAIESVHYRWEVLAPGRATADEAPGLLRERADFEMRGSYEALRTWMATLLAAQPALAVHALRLQRKSPSESVLEIHVVLDVGYRDDGVRVASPPASVLAAASAPASASAMRVSATWPLSPGAPGGAPSRPGR
jgi:hypothetical protein